MTGLFKLCALSIVVFVTPVAVLAEVINLQSDPYSADAEGKADALPALGKALSAAKPGDTILFPAGVYRMELQKGKRLRVPQGVTLLGSAGKTRILLTMTEGGEPGHREFLGFSSGAMLDGLTIIREGAFPLVMFPVFGGDIDGVTIEDCSLDGGKTDFPEHYSHIFQVGVGKVKNFVLRRSEIRNASYGLFQANKASGSLTDVVVENCLFEANHSSDLEFNSPKGTMQRIEVRDCVFRNNKCPNTSAGFAVGFANVQNAVVENCLIHNYNSEALHVEDRSEDITLKNNTMRDCSVKQPNGVILVVNDSKNIVIENNVIDGRNNSNRTKLILVTAGGAKFKNPSGVVVKNNILLNGESTKTWYLQPGSVAEPEGNVVVEAGAGE